MRKRDVQEEADGPAESLLAQIASQRDELVVMDPNRVVRLQQLRELACELRIDSVVGVELRLLVREAIGEVVKDRPERAVAVAVVVRVEFGGLQVDGRVTDVAAKQDLGLGARLFRGLAAPAEPDAAGILQRGENPDRQASGSRATSWQ